MSKRSFKPTKRAMAWSQKESRRICPSSSAVMNGIRLAHRILGSVPGHVTMRRHQYIPIWQVKAYLPGWSGVNSMGTVWPVGSLALSRKSLETAISEQGEQGRPLQ